MIREAMTRRAVLGAILLSAASCYPPGPRAIQPPPERVPLPTPTPGTPLLARVQAIDGANAFIVRQQVETAAREGDPIYQDDRFHTGNGTRMRIVLTRPGGESIQLDENTDPILEDVGCMFLRLFYRGRMYADVHNLCVDSYPNQTSSHSKVAYEILAPQVMQVTVFEGAVTTRSLPGQTIRPGYRLILDHGRATTASPFPTTPQQRSRSVDFIFGPPPPVVPDRSGGRSGTQPPTPIQ